MIDYREFIEIGKEPKKYMWAITYDNKIVKFRPLEFDASFRSGGKFVRVVRGSVGEYAYNPVENCFTSEEEAYTVLISKLNSKAEALQKEFNKKFGGKKNAKKH